MKGVILADGQAIPTPAATQLRQLLTESPTKRVDLFHVLEKNPRPPTFSQGVFTNDFGSIREEKENSPPDPNEIPPSPSSEASSPPEERTPQPKLKRKSSTTRVKTERPPSTSRKEEGAAPISAKQPRGMHRAVSAPALWNPEDDDDLPSPFLKRTDRSATRVSAAPKGLTLEKKTSKGALRQDVNGIKSAPKATTIRSTVSRPSVGKPIARTMSSKP